MDNDFLSLVEKTLIETGLSPSRFGFEALGERQFVFQLRNGRECRRATREKVLAYIAHIKSLPPPVQADQSADDPSIANETTANR